jgi:hypothetical protein
VHTLHVPQTVLLLPPQANAVYWPVPHVEQGKHAPPLTK